MPTRTSIRTIEACLASIRAQTEEVEIIVVDNSSDDGTREAAESVADTVITAGPERSAQRNLGAAASSGRYVVFIDSDMVLDPEIAAEVAVEFERSPRAGALVLPEVSFGSGFWARCKILEKELYLGDPRVEAARAFRREAFDHAGGYDTTLTGPEDWDLPDRLRAAGWEIGRIRAVVRHDEGRLRLAETFRKKRYYGRTVVPYLARHGRVGAHKAARTALLRRPGRFVRRPATSFGLLGLKAVELGGLVVGMTEARRGPVERGAGPGPEDPGPAGPATTA
ncbi:MAG TPA: glycosyltransferase family A protein [Acidimicrobiales bacterium]|nr:glycosyltransferase family A protein [Acidimicrobiales bacterium]